MHAVIGREVSDAELLDRLRAQEFTQARLREQHRGVHRGARLRRARPPEGGCSTPRHNQPNQRADDPLEQGRYLRLERLKPPERLRRFETSERLARRSQRPTETAPDGCYLASRRPQPS
jgi:hypothetical protein